MDRYTPTVLFVPYVRISRIDSFSSLCPSCPSYLFSIFSKKVCEKRKVSQGLRSFEISALYWSPNVHYFVYQEPSTEP